MEYWKPVVGDVFRIKPFGVDGKSYVSEFWTVEELFDSGDTSCKSWDDGIYSSFGLKSFNSEFCVPAYNLIYR